MSKCKKCGQEATYDVVKKYSKYKIRIKCRVCLQEYILEKNPKKDKIKKEVKKKNG